MRKIMIRSRARRGARRGKMQMKRRESETVRIEERRMSDRRLKETEDRTKKTEKGRTIFIKKWRHRELLYTKRMGMTKG